MLVIGGAVAALVASLALVPHLGTEFLPELNEGSIWINAPFPPSVSVTEARDQTRRMRALILQIPEVNVVMSKAGRPEDGTDPKLINMAEFLVDLKPESEWTRGRSRRQVMDEMEATLETLPGIDASSRSRSATTCWSRSRRSTARS